MTTFCDFVPDDPACAPEPTPEPTPSSNGGEGKMDGGNMEGDMEMNMDDDMMQSPLMYNLTYLAVAVEGAIWGWLQMTRYAEDDKYYYGGFNGTNLQSLTSMAKSWTSTIVWTVLSITQILSMFGIAGEINIMLWYYSIVAMMGLSMIVEIVRMYIYDSAYTLIEAAGSETYEATNEAGTTATVVVTTGAAITNLIIESEMMVDTIMESANYFALAYAYEGWMYAQVDMLPEESSMDEEMMEEEMFSLFRL